MQDANYLAAVELRHYLHAHPELSFHEENTARALSSFVAERTRAQVVHRDGWFYARIAANQPATRPPVAFRADMDALPMDESLDLPWRSQTPGVAHKCGHDGHSAALAALALELDDMNLQRDVYLVFQHAEEVGGGGVACADLMDEVGIGSVFAFHNWQGFPAGSVAVRPGTSQCASMGATFAFRGRPSHASMPEAGLNPAYAVSELALYSANIPAGSPNLCMATVVGVHVGNDDFGISPGTGHVSLTLRAELQAHLDGLFANIGAKATELAQREGLELEVATHDVFPATSNDPGAVEKVLLACSSLGIATTVMGEPLRASEDFGHYLRRCKGAMLYIGNGEDYPALHTDGYDFVDGNIRVAVDVFMRLIETAD